MTRDIVGHVDAKMYPCLRSAPTADPQALAGLVFSCGDQAKVRWSGASGRTPIGL